MNRRMRITILVLVIILLAASVGLAAAVMIPSAEDLLVQSLETMEGITDGYAQVEAAVTTPEESFSITFKAWGKLDVGPNGEPAARLEIVDASKDELDGLTAVTDGVQFWLYDPNRDTVVVGQAADMAAALMEKMAEYEGQWPHEGDFDPEMIDHPETPEEAVAKLLEYVTVDRDGTEEVAAGDAYRLRMVPIADKMPEAVRMAGGYIDFWLRTSDQLPLVAEYAGSALGSARIEAAEVEINTGLPGVDFTFEIPEGTEVIEATELLAKMEAQVEAAEAIDFEPLVATELPAGAEAAEAQQLGGQVVQRYTLPDGDTFVVAQGSGLSLDAPAEATSAETVTVRGVEGTLFTNDEGTRTLLGWKEGGLSFVIGGDLSPDQALTIADSLQ
jgi:outer membrane lipoprotein-sorting protein